MSTAPLSTYCRSLLITMLLLATVLALSSSASFSPKYRAEKAVKLLMARHVSYGDCDTDMEVSAVCYHCGSLNPDGFHEVHRVCCAQDGRVRNICREWYTEEPKRGRRDSWYY